MPLLGQWPDDPPSAGPGDQPWDALDRETSRQYEAFAIYRDLGPARSVVAAWGVYAERFELSGKTPHNQFWEWSSDNEWVARARAYDAHTDRRRRAASEYARTLAREEIMRNLVPIVQRFASVLLGEPVDTADGRVIVGKMVRWDDEKDVPVIEVGQVTSAQVALFKEWCSMAGLEAPKVVEVSGKGGGPIEIRPRREQLEEAKRLDPDQKALKFKQLIGQVDEPSS